MTGINILANDSVYQAIFITTTSLRWIIIMYIVINKFFIFRPIYKYISSGVNFFLQSQIIV